MFRFVHTADIHLDSPLRSLALRAPEAAEAVGIATRTAFSRTVDLCIDEDVDALIIAGDLYDGKLRSMKTARFFAEEMRRLTGAGIAGFVLRGNHDAESVITKEMTLPEGIHVFKGRDEPVDLKGGAVHLHGVSYAKPHAPDSLLPKYKPGTDGIVDIGVMHTSLSGSPAHDDYAPCPVADLACHGYAYWALGHIHKRSVHSKPDCTIVMPGIPQGRHINEDGARSVSLVTIKSNGAVHVEERSVASVRFERIRIDLDGVEDWASLVSRAGEAFGRFADDMETDHGVVRAELCGETSLMRELMRDADKRDEELASAADRSGPLYFEKAELVDRTSSRDESGEIEALKSLITEGEVPASTVEDMLRDDAMQLVKKLPAELRDRFDPMVHPNILAKAVGIGAERILARLSEASGADEA